MEWVETTGKTVLEAREAALDRLGVHEDDAEFEVLTEERTGLFGRVKEEARVRVRVRPATPRAKDDKRKRRNRSTQGQGRSQGNQRGNRGGQGGSRGAKGGQNRENGGESRGSSGRSRDGDRPTKQTGADDKQRPRQDQDKKKAKNVTDEPIMSLPEQADIAQTFVTGLAERFGASVEFDRAEISEDEIRLTVGGDNLGRMIGQRGYTASAIDELVRTVLQRRAGSGRDGRVRVDMGGVRARRGEALGQFSRSQAAEVRESGVARALEPMGGADRKVVHDAVSDEPGVRTLSEGEDPGRHVVIVPDGDAD